MLSEIFMNQRKLGITAFFTSIFKSLFAWLTKDVPQISKDQHLLSSLCP